MVCETSLPREDHGDSYPNPLASKVYSIEFFCTYIYTYRSWEFHTSFKIYMVLLHKPNISRPLLPLRRPDVNLFLFFQKIHKNTHIHSKYTVIHSPQINLETLFGRPLLPPRRPDVDLLRVLLTWGVLFFHAVGNGRGDICI